MDETNLKYYVNLPYRVDLRFDRENYVWFARFPELPGCEADGATREEALARAEEVKELWLRMALERKRTIPEPQSETEHSGKFVLRLPKSLHADAARAAEIDEVSLNTYLVEAVAEAVQRSGLKNVIRFLSGHIQKVVDQNNAAAYSVSVLVEPVYGQDDQPATLGTVSQLPGEELKKVDAR